MKINQCVSCGYVTDSATEPYAPGLSPSSGDISICLRCGHIAAFDDDLSLRELTAEEAHEVAGDKDILAIQAARGKVMR